MSFALNCDIPALLSGPEWAELNSVGRGTVVELGRA
jgi:hypothetical protein